MSPQTPIGTFKSRKVKVKVASAHICGKGFHPESSCMKKHIDMLTQLPDKNNISLPGGANKKLGGSSFEDEERVHALVASTVRSPSFIIDFGASKGPNILLGDSSEIESKGKCSIYFDHGSFNNVLYVPGLAANLLSVY